MCICIYWYYMLKYYNSICDMVLWSTLVRQASTSGSADVWRIQWCSNMLNVFCFCCGRLVHHGLLPQCPRSFQIRSWELVPRSNLRFQVDCPVVLYLAPEDMARLVGVTSYSLSLSSKGVVCTIAEIQLHSLWTGFQKDSRFAVQQALSSCGLRSFFMWWN